MTMNYQVYITRDPAVCGGEAVIRGTRVTVRTILASLAEGMSIEEILKDFPTLEEKAVRAIIAFAFHEKHLFYPQITQILADFFCDSTIRKSI